MIPVPEPLELVVTWNGAMERPYAAHRRQRLREREAEQLRAIEARIEDPRDREPRPIDPTDGAGPAPMDLAGFESDDYVELIGRVIHDAYPRILTNHDVAIAVLGPSRRASASLMAQFSRARLALEGLGRVVRCGYTPSQRGLGRHCLQFRWVADGEWVPPTPVAREDRLARNHGPRSVASVLARVRAHLAVIYPGAATHAALLEAIAPDARRDDESLLRTISKARLALEWTGEAVRAKTTTGGSHAIAVRLSGAAKAALDGRSACSA